MSNPTDAIRHAVGAASWSSSSSADGQPPPAPLPVDVTLNLERQQQPNTPQEEDGGGGKRQRTGGGKWRPKREVLHVLMVLETTTGCRLGADALLEQQDLRGLGAGGAEGSRALATETAGRLVGTLEVRMQCGGVEKGCRLGLGWLTHPNGQKHNTRTGLRPRGGLRRRALPGPAHRLHGPGPRAVSRPGPAARDGHLPARGDGGAHGYVRADVWYRFVLSDRSDFRAPRHPLT